MAEFCIDVLDRKLTEAGIPHQVAFYMGGKILWYPNRQHKICDGVCHTGSYGHEANLIEIMGLLTPEEEMHDDVVGFLTPDEVFERIKKDYESRK